jgi:hypothetical protein
MNMWPIERLRSVCDASVDEGEAPVSSLDLFYHHATLLNVINWLSDCPAACSRTVESRCRAVVEPPAPVPICTITVQARVVISVHRCEWLSLGCPLCLLWSHQCITRVSAVTVHLKKIMGGLRTQTEWRILGRRPVSHRRPCLDNLQLVSYKLNVTFVSLLINIITGL